MLDFATSFYLPSRRTPLARIAAAAALLVLASPVSCHRTPGETESARQAQAPSLERLRDDLALIPADARIVLSLDLDRLRGLPMGRRLLAALAQQAAHSLDRTARGASIDMLLQSRRVLAALPGEREDDDRLVLIVEPGERDDARLASLLREWQGKNTAAFAHGRDKIVVAQGAWAKAAAALPGKAQGPSAANDPELRRLCERAAGDHMVWLAAIVPTELRKSLFEQNRFPDVAAIAHLSGFLDLDAGLRAELVAELSNALDAATLVHRLAAYLHAAKHHPDTLVHGFAPFLKALRISSPGPRALATLDLPAAQADELALRVEALAHAAGTK